MDHYLANAERLDLDPHPLFRSRYYFLQCDDLDLADMSPLAHYLETGAAQGLSPHPLFDGKYYADQFEFREDVPVNPLGHYLSAWRERPGLNPHPLFETNFYAQGKSLARDGGLNPLLDYVLSGGTEADPNPFLDTDYVLRQLMIGDGFQTPLEAYLELGNRPPYLEPNRLFRTKYFCKHSPDAVAMGYNPLRFYVEKGRYEGRLVSPLISKMLFNAMHLDAGIFAGEYRSHRVLALAFGGEGEGTAVDFFRNIPREGEAECICLAPHRLLEEAGREGSRGFFDLEDTGVVPDEGPEIATLVAALRNPHKDYLVVTDRVALVERLTGVEVVDFGEGLSRLSGSGMREEVVVPEAASRGRIVFPVTDWEISGVNTWIQNLSEALASMGWDVEILFTAGACGYGEGHSLTGVKVRYLDVPSSRPDYWWGCARDYLESRGPAVVLTGYDFRANSLASVMGGQVAFVGVMHSDDPVYYAQMRRLGHSFDRLVTVSQYIRDQVVEQHPEMHERVTAIPNAIRHFWGGMVEAPDPEGPIGLLYAGRIVQEQKCILSMIPLVGELEAMGIDYRFTMIGDGSEEAELRAGLGPQIESGRVVLTGRLSMEEIHEQLVKHHVFVLTSSYEGLPLALLEAISHGLVPVISDIPSGHPEVVDDSENGYLIPLGEHRQYAERIRELHADPALWSRLSAAAYARFEERFTVEAMATAMEGVLEDLFRRMQAGTLRDDVFPPLENPDRVYAFGDLLLTEAIGGLLVDEGFAKER